MKNFWRIKRFIKKWRKLGVSSFNIVTTSTEIVFYVDDVDIKNKEWKDQLRIKY